MYYNSKNEKVVYMSPCETNRRINVLLAGYTLKNPNYFVCQSESFPEEVNRYQFEYVTSGTGYIETGGKKYRVEKGDLFFLNKGCTRICYADKEQPFEKRFITATGSVLDGLMQIYGITQSIIVRSADAAGIMEEALGILERPETSQTLNEISVMLHRIIQMLALPDGEREQAPYSDAAENIKAYIDRHIDCRFTLSDIAAAQFISVCQIIRIFKARYGITPMQYAIDMKIEKSKYLLKNSKLSVRAVGDLLAFSDSRHFSKTFASKTGITPAKYRRLINAC